ncbi:MAG: osmotically inducible protein C [Bacteroides sp. SM23_62_1]|nr:MAG: osmotically inducible protein C [Bacteroides sp. SM23_62_1]
MTESINLTWVDNMAFEADVMGYKMMIDADPEFGGQYRGPKPKPLMLVALAGCTGMDLVSLLKKMRVEFDSLNVSVEGTTTDEHPKRFTRMIVIYRLKGMNIDKNKVEKAVELSKEKYCGVAASYKASMDIDYRIEIME